MELNLYLKLIPQTLYKINSTKIINLNAEYTIIKLLAENTPENLCDIWLYKVFLDRTAKGCYTQNKNWEIALWKNLRELKY